MLADALRGRLTSLGDADEDSNVIAAKSQRVATTNL